MHGDILQLPSSQKFTCIHSLQVSKDDIDLFHSHKVSEQALGRWLVTSHSLGSGSFATVRLAMDTSQSAHRQVACKTLKRKSSDKRSSVVKEAQILGALNHPNINRVFDVVTDQKFIHIFLELCTGGDLFSYISHYESTGYRLCEGEAQYIMYQLLQGLEYLHERLISHRDLKPENILLFSPGPYPRIQIADFGLARPKSYQETFNVCGTVPYLPPEGIMALDNKLMGYVGIPADCWSAGVVMYLMLCSVVIESHDKESQYWLSSQRNDEVVKRRIIDGDVDFHPEIWESIPDAEALCQWLLSPDPQKRATVYDAQNSKWIKCDLLELKTAYQNRMNSF
ncbi:Meiosis-specific serine/threonine-protein kinase mek1 [Steccherinum ochraceum]|uniref:Meiosis-specific serine/threonine-protein kinase mek1 n=1 Tax=Steccherinum ochraceum TaxID=92696 RepID=A0A4R0R2K7_9APHY|nr:Meiosis-specific serine/threonine-protein kinase mek1 [Steccherinum ochraceum]